MLEMGKWKILFICLAFIWMGVIFSLSAESAKNSEDTSYQFARVVAELFVPNFRELSEEKQRDFVARIQYPIRKTAHFVEYLILGFFLSSAFYKQGNFLKNTLPALGGGVLFAVSDELHQFFVPGRVCHIQDVLIDSTGTLSGVLLFVILFLFGKRLVKGISGNFRN